MDIQKQIKVIKEIGGTDLDSSRVAQASFASYMGPVIDKVLSSKMTVDSIYGGEGKAEPSYVNPRDLVKEWREGL